MLITGYGICMLSLIPVRKEPSEQSEQVTQILCGETFEILEKSERWSAIRNTNDRYEGWINTKMITGITKEKYHELLECNVFVVRDAIFRTEKESRQVIHWIPAGSLLQLKGSDLILNNKFIATLSQFPYACQENKINLAEDALQFLHSPYLWGGKTILGIDCSGLSQVVCRMNGISIPRDAGQQALCGQEIESLHSTLPGDLAFFRLENGKINHTGILIDSNTIIHSSGMVRIDSITEEGIIRKEDGICTHKLSFFRRVSK